MLRTLSRTLGPVLGPFESYLTMRGIKTFALRMERQCANACRMATWLQSHPRVERVHYLGRSEASRRRRHPPPAARRVCTARIVRSKSKTPAKEDVFRFMDTLKLVVRGTSLGDVHSMMLYPAIALASRDRAQAARSAWASATAWCGCARASKRWKTSLRISIRR